MSYLCMHVRMSVFIVAFVCRDVRDVWMRARVCVCVCVRACACVRVCVRVCV